MRNAATEFDLYNPASDYCLAKDGIIDLPDGIVRIMNHDIEGYELLVLEVSGPPFEVDPTKHAQDFFKIGREVMIDFS
ncbi:hypothetical protein HK100_004015 [Physocladia obscura]|uniref:Uncharacterized protein n=1 Tax=Physocladia obscura TaxID=109957 RepID=A0AAD5STN8_9FUNG|nr:hypothetical protein HK100_004015 [Physocladia obscura]